MNKKFNYIITEIFILFILIVSPFVLPAQVSVCFNIASEAEQYLATGDMDLGSSDFELGYDVPNAQIVGLRYINFSIPAGVTVTNANLQFTTDEVSTGTSNLTIKGEYTGNAAAYTSSTSNISNRTTTTNLVNWQPAQWTQIGDAGSSQLTPDLSNIINEIIAHPNYAAGNAISFIITGAGTRTAENAPIELCLDYEICTNPADINC